MLNQNYLDELAKFYEIVNANISIEDCSSFYLAKRRKNGKISKSGSYLILCNAYDRLYSIKEVLDSVSSFEEHMKYGNSYLCVIPNDNFSIDECTQFNGRSFVHFIFVDTQKKELTYDKSFHYLGVKQIKAMIDLYKICFDDSECSKMDC